MVATQHSGTNISATINNTPQKGSRKRKHRLMAYRWLIAARQACGCNGARDDGTEKPSNPEEQQQNGI